MRVLAGWRPGAGVDGRDPVHAGAGHPPGLHRRPRRRRPRGDARRDGGARRRPRPRQSPRPGRPRHRPLGPGRPLRDRRRLRLQRRPASTSGTASATSSCAGPSAPSGACAWSRRGPGSSTRSTSSSSRRSSPRPRSTGGPVAFPDTLVGTDSHTTMVNALGVLGYGVGGIEAEAVLLGQPLYQPIPRVVGVRLSGEMPRGATATDLVLVVTERLRRLGVVGSFVEFAGDGLAGLPLADRATISNMSPEFGATATLFPIDDETLAYLRLTGRPAELVALVERYAKEQGLWREPGAGPTSTTSLELDLGTVEPSLAGPRRPQDRVPLPATRASFEAAYPGILPAPDSPAAPRRRPQRLGRDRRDHVLHEHLEPDRHGRRRAPRAERRGAGPARPADREDDAWRPARGRSRRTWTAPASPSRLRRSASPWPATAARPASATPVRSTRRSPTRSRRTGSSRPRSSRATATSRAGSTRSPGPATSPRRRSSSPSPSPDGSTSTSRASPSASATTDSPSSWPTSGRRQRRFATTIAGAIDGELFRAAYASVFEGDERWRALPVPAGDRYAWDPGVDVRGRPALLRRDGDRAGARRGHRRRPGSRLARRLGDHRPHLPGGLDPGLVAGRAAGSRSTASRRSTSTRTGPGAATTR